MRLLNEGMCQNEFSGYKRNCDISSFMKKTCAKRNMCFCKGCLLLTCQENNCLNKIETKKVSKPLRLKRLKNAGLL